MRNMKILSMNQEMNLKDHYDVTIVGGGIVGSGLFRDLSLHGLKVLLIEKGDFASQTSQSSSKMLHGGIRYLEQFDFSLVHEALDEKNLWLKTSPHLARELPFCIPIYKDSKYPLWTLKLGLIVYDFLSSFKNAPHSILGREKTLESFPFLKKEGLRGSGIYYDAIVDDAKLTLENIYDGLYESTSDAFNYISLEKLEPQKDGHQIYLKDELGQKKYQTFSKNIIFAVGPFTDQLLCGLNAFPWKNILVPSKGIHLWIKKETLNLSGPVVLQTADERIIFVIPQRDAILVGTTETKVTDDFFNIKAEPWEIDYLIKELKEHFPKINIQASDILSSYAGIRPLVKESSADGNSLKAISRIHKVFQPLHHTYVIVGGKLTTFRVMGQAISSQILNKFKMSYNPNLTKKPLRIHSTINSFQQRDLTQISSKELKKIIQTEKVKTFEDLILRRIGYLGSNAHELEQDDLLQHYRNIFQSESQN